ncbi:phytanoyl-CoA dioxygenase family protein [Roseibium sp. CAU 1637]|uniref:Phytanoyl-CoA dioxygenase family protein n=1 Tax=Roseibium limicola TaxID=2816037 RepID=A0A939EJL0_9HYPH|nr:phytanoyl-CoA dioxygenase family protein [Roseibium limicola]MBO0343678.1 phytanoyl-CoA dioxygenase family protein [Roseibium limicola]
MRVLDVLKSPLWAAELATGAKSFRHNPILGSKRLNEKGLHLKRALLAERMSDWRRRRMEKLVSPEDRAQYAQDGFIRRSEVLDAEEISSLREEVENTRFEAYDFRQGNAVTRFIPLPPEVLRALPHLRRFVTGDLFQNSLKYVASTTADPIVFLHVVLTDPTAGEVDPQTNFHSDTFHATAKAWFFLYDVPLAEGPFTYVPGSHRLTQERQAWELAESISAAHSADGHHALGSFRVNGDQLQTLGLREPVSFDVPGNTLVVADTHGFHARGKSERPSVRVGVYGSLRRNPYLPFTGFDPLMLPGVQGRQAQLHMGEIQLKAKLFKRRPSHTHVGKIQLRDPSPI